MSLYFVAFHNLTYFSFRGFLGNSISMKGFNFITRHVEMASTALDLNR